jgi:hypothetical protein
VAKAKAYPFMIPSYSYIFCGGQFHELPKNYDCKSRGRLPVLAIGSNQSPEQLRDKYTGTGLGEIPVTKAVLRNFDVVYSA